MEPTKLTTSLSIQEFSSHVDDELKDIINSRQVPLYRMMSYHMGWSDSHGLDDTPLRKERVHGVLCLLGCQAVGGNLESAIPAAAAVELVNSFTEIHDDVQGGNPQRDSRDAVWWVWGPAQAINTGDGMHALARLALFRLLERGVSPEKTFQAVHLMDEASLETCEGRFMDLEAQERIDLSVDAYMKMAAYKSGSLMACAASLGGLVGHAADDAIQALGEYGSKLGMAIQINQDLREIWGEDGSPPSAELMNKKKLLPVVYALEKATISEKRSMGEIFFKRVLEPDDVVKLREVVEGLGVKDDCENLVKQYRDDAVSALDTAGILPEGKIAFSDYIETLIAR